MKKNIEWAKKEIKELMTEESQNYPHDEMIEKEIVLGILNQLDEPEVLSRKLPVIPKHVADWIDDQEEEPKFYVLDKEDRPLLLRFSQGIMRAPSGLSPIDKIVKNQRNSMQFTEQEIRSMPKGEIYFKYFAVPVEVEEDEK